MYRVNIQQRFQQIFGIVANRYNSGVIESSSDPTRIITSTPVFDNIQILQNGQPFYEFPIEPLVDVETAKKIVSTDIVYENAIQGTVNEIISIPKRQITIRGLLVSADKNTLFTQIRELDDLFKRNESLQVTSRLFNALRITNIVISNMSLPALEALPDTQPFTVSAFSDVPLELVLNLNNS